MVRFFSIFFVRGEASLDAFIYFVCYYLQYLWTYFAFPSISFTMFYEYSCKFLDNQARDQIWPFQKQKLKACLIVFVTLMKIQDKFVSGLYVGVILTWNESKNTLRSFTFFSALRQRRQVSFWWKQEYQPTFLNSLIFFRFDGQEVLDKQKKEREWMASDFCLLWHSWPSKPWNFNDSKKFNWHACPHKLDPFLLTFKTEKT